MAGKLFLLKKLCEYGICHFTLLPDIEYFLVLPIPVNSDHCQISLSISCPKEPNYGGKQPNGQKNNFTPPDTKPKWNENSKSIYTDTL